MIVLLVAFLASFLVTKLGEAHLAIYRELGGADA